MIKVFFLIFIFLFIFVLYKRFTKHYWFNVALKMHKGKYFTDNSFNNESIIEYDISRINLNEFLKLYENYFPSFKITENTFKSFFNKMNNPVIIYKKEDIIISNVFNSINDISYLGNTKKINFVDYAITDINNRNKNIFQGLMNQVANYTNIMNTELIIFKIDIKPIPSFKDYNFTSNYWLGIKQKMEINKSIVEKIDIDETSYKLINNFFIKNFKFYPILKRNSNLANILINDIERITIIIDKKIIINLKYNSPDYLEILYIFCFDENEGLIVDGIRYINNNFDFKYLIIDDIGNNYKLIDLMGEYFRKRHITYHYILGLKEQLDKKDIYYYF